MIFTSSILFIQPQLVVIILGYKTSAPLFFNFFCVNVQKGVQK